MEKQQRKGGRPPKSDANKLAQRSIRMPPDLWAKIDARGLAWLRDLVRTAGPPA